MSKMDVLSTAHITMLEEVLEFCKSKKRKQGHQVHHVSNANCCQQGYQCQQARHVSEGNCYEEAKGVGGANDFKGKLILYFGEYLPVEVIDELCKLVNENSYGKCSFCSMPTESSVLSVLQILLDASKKKAVNENHVHSTNSSLARGNNDNGIFVASLGKVNSQANQSPINAGIFQTSNHQSNTPNDSRENGQNGFILHSGVKDANETRDCVDNNRVNFTRKSLPVVHCNQSFRKTDGVAQFEDPVFGMKKQEETNHVLNKRCSELGNHNHQMYNKKPLHCDEAPSVIDLIGLRAGKSKVTMESFGRQPTNFHGNKIQCHGAVDRFPVSDLERSYYNIICGLANGPWKNYSAVEFTKTNVSYLSLGESVAPRGHVDNFFIAGYCRKLFEDDHPSQSKKHFFYPKIGLCLLAYASSHDAEVVKKSFWGANLAHKLHLSDKLCFPVIKGEHWFIFVLDLKNKLYVFLDSYYSENDSFQICACRNLINAFRECWYEHAEVKLNVDGFHVLYPAVPKQSNKDDCGIFALKFMELWDKNIDLREVFNQSDIPNLRIRLGIDLYFSKQIEQISLL